MSDDPYSSPDMQSAFPERACATDARLIVREWERLRLFYNAVLAIFGVAVLVRLAAVAFFAPGMLIVGSGMVAIGANVCFCLGPLWEIYSCVFRDLTSFSPKPRLVVFVAGLLLSIFLFAFIAWRGEELVF